MSPSRTSGKLPWSREVAEPHDSDLSPQELGERFPGAGEQVPQCCLHELFLYRLGCQPVTAR
jgi:hypothetical protein